MKKLFLVLLPVTCINLYGGIDKTEKSKTKKIHVSFAENVRTVPQQQNNNPTPTNPLSRNRNQEGWVQERLAQLGFNKEGVRTHCTPTYTMPSTVPVMAQMPLYQPTMYSPVIYPPIALPNIQSHKDPVALSIQEQPLTFAEFQQYYNEAQARGVQSPEEIARMITQLCIAKNHNQSYQPSQK